MRRLFVVSSFGGVISSIIIGLFFKWIEQLTGKKVYSLLLNIDYVPLLKNYQFNEVIEFSFHIIVSIGLSYVIFYIITRFIKGITHIYLVIFIISILVGLFIYPVTHLSDRTPDLIDVIALFYWLFGHFIYGASLVIFYRLFLWNK